MFHKEIFRLAGHKMSWELIASQYKHTIRFHMLDFNDTEIFKESLEEHRPIVDYYEVGDKKKLKEVLNAHYDLDLRNIKTVLNKYGECFLGGNKDR